MLFSGIYKIKGIMILLGNKEKTLPKIIYEETNGTIHIKGRCIAQEIQKYFENFLPYLKDYLVKNPTDINVHIDVEYFSTIASKILMEFFYILKEHIQDKGFDVDVYWYYEKEIPEGLQNGKDYESLSKLTFHFVEKN